MNKATIVLGDFTIIDHQIENKQDLAFMLSDGEFPYSLLIGETAYGLIGLMFHAAQQCGTRLLYKGRELTATRIEDTSGSPVKGETPVLYNGKQLLMHELFLDVDLKIDSGDIMMCIGDLVDGRYTPGNCTYCNGNDVDMPCAFPSEGKPGCLRDERKQY